MAIFDDWALFVTQVLKAESDYSAALVDHPVLVGDARETIVESVLKRILPSSFEVGRGQVVDSFGKRSRQIDIVIARNDSPALTLQTGDKLYLIESVLATIEVKSSLTKEQLVGALDNCSSVADLTPCVNAASLELVLSKSGIRKDADGTLLHPEYLEVQRHSQRGFPASYVFGFQGYSSSVGDLANAVNGWIDNRFAANLDVHMRHLPSVIATEGCFACRNAEPFAGSPQQGSGESVTVTPTYVFGREPVPLRLLISHLLATLYARIPWSPDIEGLTMEPRRYIKETQPVKYEKIINLLPPVEYDASVRRVFGDPPPPSNRPGEVL